MSENIGTHSKFSSQIFGIERNFFCMNVGENKIFVSSFSTYYVEKFIFQREIFLNSGELTMMKA